MVFSFRSTKGCSEWRFDDHLDRFQTLQTACDGTELMRFASRECQRVWNWRNACLAHCSQHIAGDQYNSGRFISNKS